MKTRLSEIELPTALAAVLLPEPGRPSMNKICGCGVDVCIEVPEIILFPHIHQTKGSSIARLRPNRNRYNRRCGTRILSDGSIGMLGYSSAQSQKQTCIVVRPPQLA